MTVKLSRSRVIHRHTGDNLHAAAFRFLTFTLATVLLRCGSLYADELPHALPPASPPQAQTLAPVKPRQAADPLTRLQRWQQKMGRMDQHFQEADLNKDGRISREEARQEAMRRFDEVDANKDNFLTREELQVHALAKKQQRHSVSEK